jgi:hypothetical protein
MSSPKRVQDTARIAHGIHFTLGLEPIFVLMSWLEPSPGRSCIGRPGNPCFAR